MLGRWQRNKEGRPGLLSLHNPAKELNAHCLPPSRVLTNQRSYESLMIYRLSSSLQDVFVKGTRSAMRNLLAKSLPQRNSFEIPVQTLIPVPNNI